MEKMKPTLLVLAAGMGSRYGGLKQLDQVGPNGETIIDYSIYDAIQAGFGKVVFIIRHDFEAEFRKAVGDHYAKKIEVDYAFQSLDDLPASFKVPEGRQKPWGTGQAVYAARKVVKEPFAVINGDDFYGRSGYCQMAKYLSQAKDGAMADYCMCGFQMKNTLSENGSVSRGVCDVVDGKLTKVVEHTTLERDPAGSGVLSKMENGSVVKFTGEEIVSMNLWGFTPSLFDNLERLFIDFLSKRGNEMKSEFYIPSVADTLIREKLATVEVMTSKDSWFGVTYREDKEFVMNSIRELVAKGVYPEKLF